MKDQGIFSSVIILLILITLSLDSVWISLGENWCWSLLGLKGLRSHDGEGNGGLKGFNNQNNNSARTSSLLCTFIGRHCTSKGMSTLYRTEFAPPGKSYRTGLLFTHKNGCGGETSVTERNYGAKRISKVECHISDRFYVRLRYSVNTYSARHGSE